MPDDFTIKAPDVSQAFDRASKGVEKKIERPKPALQPRSPSPSPGGLVQQPAPLVSPQLREEDPKAAKVRSLVASMLARREFNRAARDGFER